MSVVYHHDIVTLMFVQVLSLKAEDRLQALESYFHDVVSNGQEGLILKSLFSSYELGPKSKQLGELSTPFQPHTVIIRRAHVRSQSDELLVLGLWVKMKPEYGDQIKDIDCLILGAYFGEGKSIRGKGWSTFLLGVKDDDNQVDGGIKPDGAHGGVTDTDFPRLQMDSFHEDLKSQQTIRWQTLCKVGSGYSFDTLIMLRSKLEPHAIHCNPTTNTKADLAYLSHWKPKKAPDVPNVLFPPEHSVVVTLKCSELVPSTQFSVGLTCRFPRLIGFRYDKDYTDVMTTSEIQSIYKNPRLPLPMESQTAFETYSKRRKKKPEDHHRRGKDKSDAIDSKFKVKSVPDSQQQGQIFEGQAFCVIDGTFRPNDHDFASNETFGKADQVEYSREEVMRCDYRAYMN
jgi:hypothetical protein